MIGVCKMSKFDKDKKSALKDITVNKDFVGKVKKPRGRSRTANKRDKTYTFYCTQNELDELERLANERHFTLAEYFRVKLFN